jgi:hypothetical protein
MIAMLHEFQTKHYKFSQNYLIVQNFDALHKIQMSLTSITCICHTFQYVEYLIKYMEKCSLDYALLLHIWLHSHRFVSVINYHPPPPQTLLTFEGCATGHLCGYVAEGFTPPVPSHLVERHVYLLS